MIKFGRGVMVLTNRNDELMERNQESSSLMTTSGFENYLQELGLPYEGILASDQERQMMGLNLPFTVGKISPDLKKDAKYLSKFVASSALGLYDAALNYLWNEVVLSFKRKSEFIWSRFIF